MPQTEKTSVDAPTQAELISQHNDAVRSQAIATALRVAGLAAMTGGGYRLLQEAQRRYLPSKDQSLDSSEDEVAISVGRPQKKKRVKKASEGLMKTPKDWAWTYPLLFGGAGLGLYGGYAGVRTLADALKKQETEAEIEEARREFEEALEARYRQANTKYSHLNRAIDSAYERWLAQGMDKEASYTAAAAGTGITAAALLWLLSHQAAYDRVRKSDPQRFQKELLEHRRRMRQAITPPPITFDPLDEEDEDEEKKAEALEGGLADNKDSRDIAATHNADKSQIDEQVAEGTKVETEHTDDPQESTEIAKDHVEENPEYYDDLEEMEEQAEKKMEIAGSDPLRERPTSEDVAAILDFVKNSPNLDDSAVHEKSISLGVEPDEAEEVTYSALQDLLKAHGDEVDPATIQEREPEETKVAEGWLPDFNKALQGVQDTVSQGASNAAMRGAYDQAKNTIGGAYNYAKDTISGVPDALTRSIQGPAIQKGIGSFVKDPKALAPSFGQIANDKQFIEGGTDAARTFAKSKLGPTLGSLL